MITRMLSVGFLAVALFVAGCGSPAQDAQKLYDSGKYEELIAKYANDASMSSMVTMAKEKRAEQLLKEKQYTAVIETYPGTKAAIEARNAIAQELYEGKKFDELMAKYGDTPAAMKAKLEMEQARVDSLSKAVESKDAKIGNQQQTIEDAARKELQRINGIANPRLKDQAMHDFIESPKFKGTKAQAEAKAAHNH